MTDEQYQPIAFEGLLTEEEKMTLGSLRSTEPFRILRKICAQEYAKISMRLTTCESDRELTLAQGQLTGIMGIYNMLVTLGKEQKKAQRPLLKHQEILQNKAKRG